MAEISNRYNEQKESGLKYGIIEVTTRCQLRCPGCYMVERRKLGSRELSLQEAIAILDLCKAYRGSELESMDILGGEPLLWPHLKEYIEILLARGIQPWIFTNMVAITPEMATWLFERKVFITGKLNIADPTDPDQLELQAAMIGSSVKTAKRFIAAIDLFIKAGYQYPLLRLENLIRKKNIQLVPGYIKFCKDRSVGYDIELMGSSKPIGPDYFSVAPTPEELAEMIKILEKDGVLPNAKQTILMPHIVGACCFYNKGLYFAADKTIRACSNSGQNLASLTDPNPIKKAYESSLISCRHNLKQELMSEPCLSCDRWDKCHGGCRATTESMGNPYGGYPLCPLPYL